MRTFVVGKSRKKCHRYTIASHIRIILQQKGCCFRCGPEASDRMSHVAQALSFLCLCWTVLFLLWGGTASGKSWFSNVAKSLFDDYKGGTPLVVLAFPIMLSATVSAALWRRKTPGDDTTRISSAIARISPRWLLRICRGRQMHLQIMVGDASSPQIISWGTLFLFVAYMAGAGHRKLQSAGDETFDWQVMEISNIFGFTALVAMCILLIPVTKFSPLIKVFGVSAPTALSLHQTCGRLVVIASLVHGAMHAYRWTGIAGEHFLSMIIPPVECTGNHPDFEPTCQSEETDCSCYDIWKNLAGAVAGVGLALIGVTSLGPVRRRMYWLFYHVHVLAGPLVFVAVVVHWNRSILYLAGGVLYYLAMYVPTAAESMHICGKVAQGVTLLSAERITDEEGHDIPSASFLSLTFQADPGTVSRYQPTQHAKLKVPALSSVAHPFSINRVPNQHQQLRLIIRESGAFTRVLGRQLGSEASNKDAIFLEGFYGTETRLSEIMEHDVVVLVAGGIGITTYLTLIKDTVQIAARRPDRRIRKIFLHWICRERHLIDYIRREYFDDIASLVNDSRGIHVSITIYNTGRSLEDVKRTYPDIESLGTEKELEEEPHNIVATGRPFRSSRYEIGSGTSFVQNLLPLVSLFLMSVLGLYGTWYFYSQVQDADELFSRFWVLLFMLALGAFISLLLNLASTLCFQRIESSEAEFAPIRSDEGVEMEIFSGEHNVSISAGGIQREDIRTFSIEEKRGRPSIHSLLHPLEESKYPAVFSCGPGLLMKEVRNKSLGRCRMRLQRFVCGEPRIALYEEAFEM
eukprot:scaffold2479_cov151-Amphora_coffeaeformis.AAC.6